MTTTIIPDIRFKEKVISTNLNNKLSCPFFIHIDKAGVNGIPESFLEKIKYVVKTKDGSHAPVTAKIINSIRQPLEDISEALTLLSHGMKREEFIVKVLTEVPGTNNQTEMVTYFYQQVQE